MDHTYFSNLSDEALQELLTGYALGALEPDEMLDMDAYLQSHPELNPIVERLADASTAFAYVVPQVAPPPTAKAALMARIEADLRETSGNLAGQTDSTGQSVQSAHRPPPPVTPFAARANAAARRPVLARPRGQQPGPRQRWNWFFNNWFDFATGWKMATVASFAILLFFVIATSQLSRQLNNAAVALNDAEGRLAGANARLNSAESALAELQGATATQTDELTTIQESLATVTETNAQLEAVNSELETQNAQLAQQLTTIQNVNSDLQDALQTISGNLQTQEQQLVSLLNANQVVGLNSIVETDARGTLFVGEDSLVLVLSGLQPLPEDQTYELWLIPADSTPVSAGLVQVTGGDTPSITADINLSISSFAAVGLSIEQQGGSTSPDGPEGPVILLGESNA